MGNQGDSSTDDDALVWKRLADSVTAYEPAPSPVRAKPSPSPRRGKQPAKPRPRPVTTAKTAAAPTPIDLRAGEHAGLDRMTRRRLVQGQQPIEARLDLHGLTAAQAERKLSGFIANAEAGGCRCVLVITGKGANGNGVLRRLVPLWLKTPPLSSRVLAISTARQADGGEGALYVMLRRRRQPA